MELNVERVIDAMAAFAKSWRETVVNGSLKRISV
jgi:hypothetical protein